MSDGTFSENLSESNISMANDAEELNSQGSVDKRVKGTNLPTASNITKKIRSKLPNVGYYLRRLMRLKSGGNLESEKEPISNISEMTEITETINEQTIPEDEDSISWSENRDVKTNRYEIYGGPSNDFRGHDPGGPSSSSSNENDDTSEYPAMIATAEIEPVQTISNSVTTEAMTTNGIFVNVLNRENIPGGNILEFREALSSHMGSQVEEVRDQETRNVPLFYIQTDDRQELYLQNTLNVESGFSGSNTRGSEVSSISENENSEVRNQRIGQDRTPQFFGAIMSVDKMIRKPICRNDDEPTIY
ncbi:uncharacterized protein LOC113218738 [Apis mellifera]|uniref:Uncharacterized protein LOC113218738 n=1 Tax=Apis mellifera TaxID=7460 RepID=A0A7M7MKE0_APIME|nr:uncharacterized protein LOC113218738 [Apis mellifera]|eukprot:XP_026296122.1 uncharacterized protein LOC113218738 [Apis mellifera]